MEIRIQTENQQVAGILAALNHNLADEKQASYWAEALLKLLSLNNPRHSGELLGRKGIAKPSPQFPLYQMVLNGNEKFLPFREAYVAFDSGWMDVDTGQFVIDEGFKLRPMTPEDKRKISNAADEYSASK